MWDGKEENWIENLWRKLVEPMIEYEVPWAIALGNHDREVFLLFNFFY